MTAQSLNRQLVPTISQRQALAADHAHRYAEVQAMREAAIVDFQVARLRYEMERISRQPDPCLFVAPVEEAPKVVGASMENRVIGYFAVAVACLFLVAHFWGLA